ncbi:MAG TPA: hypothetical protein VFE96_01085 [Candidatus Bathyarchaeia archaeon]|jgi:hypothetical protein|nr:hypothetical protein [Candidatus Bathyarchaeia archaeon]
MRGAEAEQVILEHGRRMLELLRDAKFLVLYPASGKSGMEGIAILPTDPEEAKRIIDEDPAIKSGVYTYEVHPARVLPGDSVTGRTCQLT